MPGARLFVLCFCVVLLTGGAPPKAAEQAPLSAKTPTSEPTFSPQNAAPPAAPAPTGRLAQAPSKAAPVSAAQSKTPEAAKSPSILQMLEGHETELMVGAAIAAAFFIIGWICGGNYYLRRDRLQRRKIRF
jgi:hypothetical protein